MFGTNSGNVIWITGLSGSGKTTLAKALQKKMAGAILLDGDQLREALAATDHGFDPESRKKLAYTYARLAQMLAMQGFTVLVATISLFHELHDWNRENLPGYLEIFLDVPEEVRRKRDPKGLYATGTRDMAGVSHVAEFPKKPHLHLGSDLSLDESMRKVFSMLENKI